VAGRRLTTDRRRAPAPQMAMKSPEELMEYQMGNRSIFSDQFKEVLKGALEQERKRKSAEMEVYLKQAREQLGTPRGQAELQERTKQAVEKERMSAEEQVLLASIDHARASIGAWARKEEEAKAQAEAARKQLQRLVFVLEKVRQDQAYRRVVEDVAHVETRR